MSTEQNIEIFMKIYVGCLVFLSIIPYIHLIYVLVIDGCIARSKKMQLQKHLHQKIKEPSLQNKLIQNFDGYDEL